MGDDFDLRRVATITLAACGSSVRTTAMALPVASTTTSSSLCSVRPKSGGHIHLRSGEGQGTTVTIYLPRYLGDVEDETVVSATADLSPTVNTVVLVVEDEPPIRMVIADVLSDLGYTVLEAGDGRSGLKIIEAGTHVDLLITDVGLPGGMNGRQLADAARERRPNLNVLFVTGYAENSPVGSGFAAQGMQVMTKPFSLEALAARIQGIIGR